MALTRPVGGYLRAFRTLATPKRRRYCRTGPELIKKAWLEGHAKTTKGGWRSMLNETGGVSGIQHIMII